MSLRELNEKQNTTHNDIDGVLYLMTCIQHFLNYSHEKQNLKSHLSQLPLIHSSHFCSVAQLSMKDLASFDMLKSFFDSGFYRIFFPPAGRKLTFQLPCKSLTLKIHSPRIFLCFGQRRKLQAYDWFQKLQYKANLWIQTYQIFPVNRERNLFFFAPKWGFGVLVMSSTAKPGLKQEQGTCVNIRLGP